VFRGESALGMGEPAEADQIPHRQAQGQVVALLEDGQLLSQRAGLPVGDGLPFDVHLPAVHGDEPAHHGQQGALAGSVGTDEGRDALLPHRQTGVLDRVTGPVTLGHAVDDDHGRASFKTRRRKYTPPTKLTMTLTLVVKENTRSTSNSAPTRATALMRDDPTSKIAWRWV